MKLIVCNQQVEKKLLTPWEPKKGFGYAKDPMSPRLVENWKRLPSEVHFIYGGKSWITSDVGLEISDKLKILSDGKISSKVEVIENATHHLMCTHPSEMNSI